MKLLFVYNVNSGFLDKLIDNAHKIVSPSTYDCNLCSLTYGNFSEDELWRAFREHSALEMEFLHKDEFLRKYRSKWLPKYEFPTILKAESMELELFLPAPELNALNSSEELIEEIQKRVESID